MERKSIIPVQETIIIPNNNGAVFTTGNRIEILLSKADITNWVVQDSFFLFNLVYSYTANVAGAALAITPHYIRYLPMIFDTVEVMYAGNQIYYQPFNQQAKFIEFCQLGGGYLDTEIYSTTTSKNRRQTRLKVTPDAITAVNTEVTVTGALLRIGDLINMFANILEFPMNLIDDKLQINLKLAHPNTYVTNSEAPVDFSLPSIFKPGYIVPAVGNRDFTLNTYRIDQFELHVKSKISLNPNLSSADKTIKFEYSMNQIAQRGIGDGEFPRVASSINIPFNIVSENVSNMGIYFYKGLNPCISYRPELINVNFKYGNNNSPFSPINVDSYTNPSTYKNMTNDTFDISTSYFTTTNYDYNESYPYLEAGTADNLIGKSDTHITLATDYVYSGRELGPPSKVWNSQYVFQGQTSGKALPACTAVMWVKTKYMSLIENGRIVSVNI